MKPTLLLRKVLSCIFTLQTVHKEKINTHMVLHCTPKTYNFLKSVYLFKEKIQIVDIANGRTNERALSAMLTVERGYNIN